MERVLNRLFLEVLVDTSIKIRLLSIIYVSRQLGSHNSVESHFARGFKQKDMYELDIVVPESRGFEKTVRTGFRNIYCLVDLTGQAEKSWKIPQYAHHPC